MPQDEPMQLVYSYLFKLGMLPEAAKMIYFDPKTRRPARRVTWPLTEVEELPDEDEGETTK